MEEGYEIDRPFMFLGLVGEERGVLSGDRAAWDEAEGVDGLRSLLKRVEAESSDVVE